MSGRFRVDQYVYFGSLSCELRYGKVKEVVDGGYEGYVIWECDLNDAYIWDYDEGPRIFKNVEERFVHKTREEFQTALEHEQMILDSLNVNQEVYFISDDNQGNLRMYVGNIQEKSNKVKVLVKNPPGLWELSALLVQPTT